MRTLPYGSVSYIQDPELEQETQEIIAKSAGALWKPDVTGEFLNFYQHWITSTQVNQVQGFDQFKSCTFSLGTTEAFDKFYLKHRHRRLRFFQGEYMYHLAAAERYFTGVAYLEHQPLDKNDVVVVSLPFADTGNQHDQMSDILRQCEQLSVPVMIDAAYFGVCGNVNFDFTSPAIETVVFSLSKSFPLPHLRVGMRCQRVNTDDALDIYNNTNYVNRLGASVGLMLMQRHSADRSWNLYRNTQLQFCQQLEVKPSNCVFFGLDLNNHYPAYNRGGPSNRLCFSRHLYKRRLPS